MALVVWMKSECNYRYLGWAVYGYYMLLWYETTYRLRFWMLLYCDKCVLVFSWLWTQRSCKEMSFSKFNRLFCMFWCLPLGHQIHITDHYSSKILAVIPLFGQKISWYLMVWPNPIINGVLNDDKYLKILRYTHCYIG